MRSSRRSCGVSRGRWPPLAEGFEVLAAVDILGGRCVRLLQGDYRRVTDYGDPVERANRWRAQGA
ncbi:MAG TPA: HisA/HisF-related TIM barrel protein, partial [Bacillota bacterium]